jgi:hypothetical protein
MAVEAAGAVASSFSLIPDAWSNLVIGTSGGGATSDS